MSLSLINFVSKAMSTSACRRFASCLADSKFKLEGRCECKILNRRLGNKRRRFYSSSSMLITQEMPDARGLPFIGPLMSIISSGGGIRIHEYIDQQHQKYGPIFRGCVGPAKAVFISSPEEFRRVFRLEGPAPKHFLPEAWLVYNEIYNCKRGLFFMNDEEWLHFRRILNKVMLITDPDTMMSRPCQEAAEVLATRWKAYAKDGVPVPNLELQLYKWSIEVVLASMLGTPWLENQSKILKNSEGLAKNLHSIFEYSKQLSSFPVKIAVALKLPCWTNFVVAVGNALQEVQQLLPKMVEIKGDGLLAAMMDKGIEGEDLTRIVVDLIMAAGDTTAYSMQWILFLLASHPETQDHICQVTDPSTNPMIRCHVKESLRLYPTAPFLTRFLTQDSFIGGYPVLKGELLILSLYTSGRDAANFYRPNEFLPERWLRDENGYYKDVINPLASIPFALGARSCIGKKLAETQMYFTLAELAKTFRMTCPNKDRIKMHLRLISMPSEPIQLMLTPRS